jgi:hypothetical protein
MTGSYGVPQSAVKSPAQTAAMMLANRGMRRSVFIWNKSWFIILGIEERSLIFERRMALALRAIAFHNSVSKTRLDELFGEGANEVFAGSSRTACARCRTSFALWFKDRQDPEIPSHTKSLEARIAEDCMGGKHPNREIRLDITP